MTKRTIKFRAKRTDKNWWVYGYLFKTPLTTENFNCAGDRNWFDEGKGRWCIVHEHGVVFEIDESSVCEYTGLPDKDGKNIYEGDIIQIVWVQEHWQTHTGDNISNGSYTGPDNITIETCNYVVKFENGAFVLDNPEYDVPAYDNLLSTHLSNWNDNIYAKDVEDYFEDYFEEQGYKTISELKQTLGVRVIGNIHDNPELLLNS